MKLQVKNLNLVSVIKFLDGLELKGLKGIHRTNLSFKLQEFLEKVMDAETQIQKELKGNTEQIKKDLKELHESYAVVDTGDSQTMLSSVSNTVKEVVDNEESAFEGQEAYGLAILYNAFNTES